MEYTKTQQAAIATIDDPLLVVACAGSGKTQVISQRVVEILRRPGVTPDNIVAFTFTEKAAAELKERVTELVTAEFGNIIGLAELFIGTMHGYALDALQSYVAETFKYGVLDEIQTRLLIDRHSRKSGLTDAMGGPLVRHVRDHVRYVVVDEYQDTASKTCAGYRSATSPVASHADCRGRMRRFSSGA